MTEGRRRLLIMRHAKSAWDTEAGNDFDRPLAPRGERDCDTLGQLIGSLNPLPDHVLCSGAVRTRRTWEAIKPHVYSASNSESTRISPTVVISDDLYASSLSGWLKTIAQLDDVTRCVLLIGHNPELQSLLIYLAGDQVTVGDSGKIMPTATLAVMDVALPWRHLREDCATLIDIYRPSELRAGNPSGNPSAKR